ncbi:hypothetical protein EW093_10500 [Thiospirochaeta perfilievii]|uniref:FlgD/Vpr Ig-like domain-containing protein n=1 Tax=Thiospirochaeta perfilievii TaxID=252967 RepID=A0A5C1QFY1_9SPIO|nr:FlgD immunoglobulin-like domain containing protein [Thiospirochaeta perfilievii]QEN05122.1 hypothetical protein EW093_10500 [Thiospirochaeta perfilievii]
MKKLKFLFLTLFMVLAVVVFSQSRIPGNSSNYISVTGAANLGNHDTITVFFFEVPDTYTQKLYFSIYDPDISGGAPDNGTGASTFYLYGGSGALSASNARNIDYTSLVEAQTGTLLSQFTDSSTYNGEWKSFDGVYPSQGEHIGNKYYFRVVATADASKNGFQADVSYSSINGGSNVPTGDSNILAFSYNWSVIFQNVNTWNLYPYVPKDSAGNIEVYTWDFDNGESTTGPRLYDISNKIRESAVTTSGDGANYVYGGANSISVDSTPITDTNGTWRLEVIEDNTGTGGDINPAEIWFGQTNASTVFRTYSSYFVANDPDHITINVDDAQADTGSANGDGEYVTLQVVDSAGAAIPYVLDLYISVTGSAEISFDPGTGWQNENQAYLATTDNSGMFSFYLRDGLEEDVTLTILTDGTNGTTTLSGTNDSQIISFNDTAPPTVSIPSDLQLDINSAGDALGNLIITDVGGGNITAANDIRILLPASLVYNEIALTNAGNKVLSGGTVGDVNLESVSTVYSNGGLANNLLTIDVTADFDAGRVLTITGLLVDSSNSEGLGNIKISVNGGVSYTVIDSHFIEVKDLSTNRWYGTVSSDWETAGNWSLGLVPTNAHDVIIPDAVNDPLFGASHTDVKSLTIESGATVYTAGFNLTVTGEVSGEGYIDSTGGGLSFSNITSLGGFSISGGSVNFTGIEEFEDFDISGATCNASGTSLTINGTISGSGTISSSNTDVSINEIASLGTLDINSGTLDIISDSTLTNLELDNITFTPTLNITTTNTTLTTNSVLNIGSGKEFYVTNQLDDWFDSIINLDGGNLYVDNTNGNFAEINLTNNSTLYVLGSSVVGFGSLTTSNNCTIDIGSGSINVPAGLTGSPHINSSGGSFEINQSINATITGSFSSISLQAGGTITYAGDIEFLGNAIFTNVDSNGYKTFFNGTGELTGSLSAVFDDIEIGSSGNLTLGSAISISGDWINNGVFINNNNDVTFEGSAKASAIYGDNSFKGFLCATDSKKLIFEAGKTQTIAVLDLSASDNDNAITLSSTIPGTKWNLINTESHTTQRLLVIDSDATGSAATIDACTLVGASYDGGNNTNWNGFTTQNTWLGGAIGNETNWNEPSNWSEGVVPPGGSDVFNVNDRALIPTGKPYYPVLTGQTKVAFLIVSAGAEIDLAGNNLQVYANFRNQGTIRINGSASITDYALTPISDIGSGTVEFYGSATDTSGWGQDFYNLVISSSGAVTLNSASTVYGTMDISSGSLDIGANTLTLKGDISNSGSGISTTGVVNIDGNVYSTGDFSFNNLNITAGNRLTLAGNLEISGDLDNLGDLVTSNNKVTFNGTNTITGNSITFGDIENIGSLTLNQDIQVGGNWIFTTGFSSGIYDVEFVDGIGSSTIYGDNTFSSFTCNSPGKSLLFESNKTQTIGKITLLGIESNLITLNSTSLDKYIINNTNNTNNSIDSISVSNSTLTGDDINAGYHSVDAGGNEVITSPKWIFPREVYVWSGYIDTDWTNLTNWELSSGDLVTTLPSSTDWVSIPTGLSNYPVITDENITLKNINVSSGASLEIAGTSTCTLVSLNNDGTIIISGSDVNPINIVDTNSGTFEYTGTVSVKDFGTTDYYNIKFSGVGTKTLVNDLNINGSLVLSEGILDCSSNNINLSGNWTQLSGSTLTPGANTVTFEDSSNFTGITSFDNLVIDTGAVLNILSDIEVNNITISGILNGGSSTIKVNGDWVNSGTFNRETGTVEFLAGVGASTISGENTFNTLKCISPSKTINFPQGVTQTFYDLILDGGAIGTRITLTSGADWTFKNLKGVDAQVSFVSVEFGQIDESGENIGASDSLFDANTDTLTTKIWKSISPTIITWNGSSSSVWNLASNWTPAQIPTVIDSVIIPDSGTTTNDPILTTDIEVNNLTIETGGIFDTSDNNVTINGLIDIQGTGILKRSGLASQSISKTDNDSGTVEYVTTTTTSIQNYSGTDYYNLTISSGANSLISDLSISGSLNLSGGTLDTSTYSVIFSGGDAGSITGAINFYDLIINKNLTANTITIDTGIIVSNDLSISQGTLNLNGTDNSVSGDINLTGGILLGGSGTLALSGSFNSSGGTFTAETSTILLDGVSSSIIYGSNSFYNFSCSTSNKEIKFKSGTTQTITNAFNISGGNDPNRIDLVSTLSGSQWNLSAATSTVSNVNVQDSNIVGGDDITATLDSADLGNNTVSGYPKWIFTSIYTWDGSEGDGDWNNAANWDINSVPSGVLDVVIIPSVATNPKLPIGGVSIYSLVIETGGILDLNGQDLTLSSLDLQAGGTIKLQGIEDIIGTSIPDTQGTIIYYGVPGTGNYPNLSLGDSYYNLTFEDVGGNDDVWTIAANLNIALGGTLTLNGGVLDLDDKNLTINTAGNYSYSVGTLRLAGSQGTVFGLVANPGSDYIPGLVEYTGTTSAFAAGYLYNDLSLLAGSVITLGNNISISGDMLISGTLIDNGQTISVSGNWTNTAGTLTATGVVDFTGANGSTSVIAGNTTFDVLSSSIDNKIIQFTAGTTQSVNQLDMTPTTTDGTAYIHLYSTGLATWNISNTGAGDDNMDYVKVQYSVNTGADNLNAGTHSLNEGNNEVSGAAGIWLFPVSLTWDGSSNNGTWYDITNWTPESIPTGASTATIADVSATYLQPVLVSAVEIDTLNISTDATLDVAGNNLTINTAFNNDGTLYRTGGETVSLTDIDSGTVSYTGAGLVNIQDYDAGAGADYFNLIVVEGNKSLTANLFVAGTLDLTNSDSVLLTGVNNLTVTGAVSGFGVISSTAGTTDLGSGTIRATGTHGVLTTAGVLTIKTESITATTDNLIITSLEGTATTTFIGEAKDATTSGGSLQIDAKTAAGTPIVYGKINALNLGVDVTSGANNLDIDTGSGSGVVTSTAGDFTLAGGTTNIQGDWGLVTINGGTGAVGANSLTTTGNITGTGTLTATSGTITVGSDWDIANFTTGTSRVVFTNVTANITSGSATTFYDLEVGVGSTLTPAGGETITVSRDLLGLGTLSPVAETVVVNRNWDITGFTKGTSTVQFNNGFDSVINKAVTFNDLELVAGNLELLATVDIGAANVTLTSGTLTDNGQTISVSGNWTNTAGTLTATGVVDFTGANGSTSVIAGNTTFDVLSSSIDNKIIQFTAGTTQSVNQLDMTPTTTDGTAYIHLYSTGLATWNISNTGAGDDNMDYVKVQYSVNTGADNLNAGTHSLNEGNNEVSGAAGIWLFPVSLTWDGSSNNGTWYDITNWTPESIPTGASTATIADVSATYLQPVLVSAVEIDTLNISTDATLDVAGNNLTINTAFNNDGTLYRTGGETVSLTDIDSGTVSYTGAGLVNIQDYDAGAGADYFNLIVVEGNKSLTANLFVAGTLDLTNSDSVLLTGVNNLTVTGAVSGFGVISSTAGTTDLGSGTIRATGTHGVLTTAGVLTIKTESITATTDNLIITSLEGTATTTFIGEAKDATTSGGSLQIDAKTAAGTPIVYGKINALNLGVDVTSGANNLDIDTGSGSGVVTSTAGDFTLAGGTTNIQGDWGLVTINGGTGAVGANSLTTTGNITGTGTLTATSGTITVGSDWDIANFTTGTSRVVFTNVTANITSGSATTFYDLEVGVGSTLTPAGGETITVSRDLLGLGTLSPVAETVVVNRNWDITGFTQGTSTVQFNNGFDSVINKAVTFNDLELVAGNLELLATVDIGAANVTLTSGTLTDNGQTISVSGNWTNTAGTLTATGVVDITGADGSTSVISGNTTFDVLSSSVDNKIIQFTAGTTQSVNQLDMTPTTTDGTAYIHLYSTGLATWNISNTGAGDDNMDYVKVQYSVNTGADNLNAGTHSLNEGNNEVSGAAGIWLFPVSLTWDGSSNNGTWYDITNWTPESIPTGASTTTIADVSATYLQPVLVSAVEIDTLNISTDATLDVAGNNLTINTAFNNDGTLYRTGGETVNLTDIDSGTVSYTGAGLVNIQDYDAGAGADYFNLIVVEGNKSLTASLFVAGTFDLTNSDSVLLTGGNNLTVTGAASGLGVISSTAGTTNLGSGTIRATGTHGVLTTAGVLTIKTESITATTDNLIITSLQGTAATTFIGEAKDATTSGGSLQIDAKTAAGTPIVYGKINALNLGVDVTSGANNLDIDTGSGAGVVTSTAGDFTLAAGTTNIQGDWGLVTINGGTGAVGANSLTTTGNITGAGTLSGTTGTITAGADWDIANFTTGTSRVVFTSVAANITSGSATTFYDLEVGAGSTLTPAVGETITVSRDLLGLGTLSPVAETVVVNRNWDITGFTQGTSTVQFNNGFDSVINKAVTFNDLELVAGNLELLATVNIGAANVTLTSGTLTDNGQTISVSGNWTNTAGTLTATGVTEFIDNGVISRIFGDTTFYEFKCNTPGKTLQFEAGSLQGANIFNINGDNSSLPASFVSLESSLVGTVWNIKNNPGVDSLTYLAVQDSNVDDTGDSLDAGATSYNKGNNDIIGVSYWFFRPSVITWTGAGPDIGGGFRDWENASNWFPESVPTLNNNVNIPNVSNKPKLTEAAYTKELSIDVNAELYIDGKQLYIDPDDLNGLDDLTDLVNGGTIYRLGTAGETVTKTDSTSGTVVYQGVGVGDIEEYPGLNDYYNLTVLNGNKSLSASTIVTNDLDISSSLICNDFNLEIGGNLTGLGTLTSTDNVITLTGNWSITNYSPSATKTEGSVILVGPAALVNPSLPVTFNTLTVSGSGTKTITQDITVENSITGAGVFDGTDQIITLNGGWSLQDFIHGTSTVRFQTTQTITPTTDSDFYNLEINNASILTLQKDITVYNDIWIDNRLEIGSYNFNLYGYNQGSGDVTGTTGNVNIHRTNLGALVSPFNFTTLSLDMFIINDITVDDDFVLETSGNITFNGSINGKSLDVLSTGVGHTVTMLGTIGDTTPIGTAGTAAPLNITSENIVLTENITVAGSLLENIFTGNIDFQGLTLTSASDLKFTGGSINTSSSAVNIITTGTTKNITIDNPITQNTALNIDSSGFILLNETVAGNGNSIDFTAVDNIGIVKSITSSAVMNYTSTTGDINISDVALISSSDEITLDAKDIRVGGIKSTNVSPTAVSITTTGSLIDNGDSLLDLQTPNGGTNLNLTTGTTLPIETLIKEIQFNVTGTGDFELNQTGGDLTINGSSVNSGVTNINLTGDLYIDFLNVGVNTLNIDVDGSILESPTPDAGVDITSGNINFVTSNNISFSEPLEIAAPLMDINNTGTGGISINNIPTADVVITKLDSVGGDINYNQSINDLTINGTITTTGNIVIDSNGSILDGTIPETAIISGTDLTILSQTGSVGLTGSGDIDVDITKLVEANSSLGGVYITEVGDKNLEVTYINSTNGNIELLNEAATSGDITIDSGINKGIVSDLIDDVINISSNNGDILSLGVTSATNLDIAGYKINLVSAGVIGSESNQIDIDSGNELNVTTNSEVWINDRFGVLNVNSISAPTGDVRLTAVDGLFRFPGGSVLSDSLQLITTNGDIGTSTTPLSIDTNNIEINSGGSVYLLDSDDLVLGLTPGKFGSFNISGASLNGTLEITTDGNLSLNEDIINNGDSFITFNSGAGIIYLSANITSNNLTISDLKDIVFESPVELTGVGSTIGTLYAGTVDLDITFNSTINSDGNLQLNAGIGYVDFNGVIGGTTAVTNLTINNAQRVDLSGVGIGLDGVSSNLSVTTTNTDGLILLEGTNYRIGGSTTLNAGNDTNGLYISVPSALNFVTGATFITNSLNTFIYGNTANLVNLTGTSFTFNNLHISLADKTVNLSGDLLAQNIVMYNGSFNSVGNNITTTQDLIILGDGYNIEDPDTSVPDLFAYNNTNRVTPINSVILNSFISGFDPNYVLPVSTGYTSKFTNLSGSTLDIGGNFYNNGADMLSGSNWNLIIPDNNIASDSFAEAYNMSVQNSISNNPVTAVENSSITTSTNWFNTRPTFDITVTGLATVYDDVIRVSLTGGLLFENSLNEISTALASGLIGIDDNSITGADLASYFDQECTISTDGKGDIGTFYLRVENDPTYRWNTDATGSSAGLATSTDRGRDGIPAEHRTTVPNIVVEKASSSFLYTLQDQYKNRIEHRPLGSKITDVKDEADPVIVQIEASKHNSGTTDPFDGHNYFEITYSENVSYKVNSSVETSYGANTRSLNTILNTSGNQLGNITQSGSDVNVEGLFLYPGIFEHGTFSGDKNTHTLFSSQQNKLRIDVVGYKDGATWPGYLGSLTNNIDNYTKITNPAYNQFRNNFNGELADLISEQTDSSIINQLSNFYKSVTVPGNQDIFDIQGNILESSGVSYDAYFKTMSISGSGWDVYPPYFSKQMLENGDKTDVYEIYFLDQNIDVGNRIVDNIAFHVLDDYVMLPFWVSWTGWAKGVGISNTGIRPDPIGGIRDDLFLGNATAFKMGILGSSNYISTPITGMLTSVDTYMLRSDEGSGFEINSANDNYFSIQIDESQNWLLNNQMHMEYNASIGRITDLAGNIMPNSNNKLDPFQWIPPKILLSLSIVDDKTLYIQYTKDVYSNDPSNSVRTGINKDSFSLVSTEGNSITNVIALKGDSTETAGKKEFFLTLDQPLSANDMVNARLRSKELEVFDLYGTDTGIYDRRLTDLGLGLVSPIYANDSLHRDDRLVLDQGSIRSFDGTGRLLPEDVVIATEVKGSLNQDFPLSLYYDLDTDLSAGYDYDTTDSVYNKKLWLPDVLQGTYIFYNDLDLRELTPSGTDENLSLFSIDNSDYELNIGSTLQFIYKLELPSDDPVEDPNPFSLYCVSLPPGGSYLSDLIPWEISIEGLKTQRGGVTIVNNVINPLDGQHTEIFVEQEKPGMSTISVFSIDGTVVETLQKGRLGVGSYRYLWDGTNKSGKPVARGIYFIKVIAPGINESRKVMIVK